jgi:hypothetical protein
MQERDRAGPSDEHEGSASVGRDSRRVLTRALGV